MGEIAFDLGMSPTADPQLIYDTIREKAEELTHPQEDGGIGKNGSVKQWDT